MQTNWSLQAIVAVIMAVFQVEKPKTNFIINKHFPIYITVLTNTEQRLATVKWSYASAKAAF